MRDYAEYRFPVILGRDFSGVVERVGTGVDSFAAGRGGLRLCSRRRIRTSTAAPGPSSSAVPAGQADRKPDGVDFTAAGAAPVTGLTAMAALAALDLQDGESILIIGATGGVGSFAVQLARRAGAHIIAPGFPEDEGFLVDLGVDHVVPRDGDVVAQTRELEDGGVAALLDTVSRSPEEFEVYAAALADGGRAASPVRAAGEGPGRHNVGGSTEGGALERTRPSSSRKAPSACRSSGPTRWRRPAPPSPICSAKHTQGKLAIAVARSAPPALPNYPEVHGHPAKGRGEHQGSGRRGVRRRARRRPAAGCASTRTSHRYIAPVRRPRRRAGDHRLRDRDQAPLRGGRRQARVCRSASASRASTPSRAASTRACTATGSGRCASTPASPAPRTPTSATAT